MASEIRPYDPSDLGYPATLPIEIALRVAPVREICEAYEIDQEKWSRLRLDPVFQKDLATAVELVRKEGMSFRLKAKLQAEEMLKTSWNLVHNNDTPPAVRADLIKFTTRCAGYAEPDAANTGLKGSGFSITINIPPPNQTEKVVDIVPHTNIKSDLVLSIGDKNAVGCVRDSEHCIG